MGAQGGEAVFQGGKGGYSYGTLILDKLTNLYVYVGGEAPEETCGLNDGVSEGGYNGGGSGYNYNYGTTIDGINRNISICGAGGGGGSDIRISQDSLYARVIVAGGGSGGAYNYQSGLTGHFAGGLTSGGYNSTYTATQTSAGLSGSFGQGGSSIAGASGQTCVSAGGGGGWYGGGANQTTYNYASLEHSCYRYSGGGSGYAYTSSTAVNYPSGCLLNSSHYLTDAAVLAGDQSFTDYDGTTVTGHSGDGAVRITRIG